MSWSPSRLVVKRMRRLHAVPVAPLAHCALHFRSALHPCVMVVMRLAGWHLSTALCCRFEEARTALFRALDSRELFGVPLLVLANKQDLQDAQPPEAVQQMLGLNELKVPFRWVRGPVDFVIQQMAMSLCPVSGHS